MTKVEKIELLKLLYQYRSFGFEYFSDYQSTNINRGSSNSLEKIGEKINMGVIYVG